MTPTAAGLASAEAERELINESPTARVARPRGSARAFSLVVAAATIAFLGYTAWWARAPAPVEGDDAGIAVGAIEIAVAPFDPPNLAYNYYFQTGTIFVVGWISRLTRLDPFKIFYFLSLASTILAILFAGAWISRIVPISWGAGLLAVLLFPESFISEYYANANAIALAFGAAALFVASYRGVLSAVVAGVLLAIAAWMRFDAVLMAPTVGLQFLIRKDTPFVRQFIESAILTSVFFAAVKGLLTISHSSFAQMLNQVADHQSHYVIWESLWCHAYFFPVLALSLLAIGVGSLIAKREIRLLAILLGGSLLIYLPFARLLVTPKYFNYAIPMFAGLAAFGISAVASIKSPGRRALAVASLLLLSSQYFVGYKADVKSIWRRFEASPGVVVYTHDARRFLTGVVWDPPQWHAMHLKIADELKSTRTKIDELSKSGRPIVICRESDQWIAFNNILYIIYWLGYSLDHRGPTGDDSMPTRLEFVQKGRAPITVITSKGPKDILGRRVELEGRQLVLAGGWNLATTGLEGLERVAGAKHAEYQTYLFTLPEKK